jgi:hypothetical protein
MSRTRFAFLLATTVIGAAAGQAAFAQEGNEPCFWRNDCSALPGSRTTGGFKNFEGAINKAKRTRFKGDQTALRHKLEVSCSDDVAVVVQALVQDGGAGFFLNKKRQYVLTATFTGETGVSTSTPIVVPLMSFVKEPGNEAQEIDCDKRTIFPYLHKDAKVYAQYEIRRTKDDKLSPGLIAGAQIFAGLVGLFAGPTLGPGFSKIVTRAVTVSDTLKDNETLYNKFIDSFDEVRTIKKTTAITPADGELVLILSSAATISIKRDSAESPLLEKKANKRVRTSQDVRTQLKDFYKIEFDKIFEGMQGNVGDQLRNADSSISRGACEAIREKVNQTPGLLTQERVIVLVEYLKRFAVAPVPAISCLDAEQLAMMKDLDINAPYEAAKPDPVKKDPDVNFAKEVRPFLTKFFGSWRLAQSGAARDETNAVETFSEWFTDRVDLRREEGLANFSQSDSASDEAAARLLIKAPQLLKFGCYRRAKGETEKIGSAEAIATFGDAANPLALNLVIDVRNTDDGLLLKALLAEKPTKSVREFVKKDDCYKDWKPFP